MIRSASSSSAVSREFTWSRIRCNRSYELTQDGVCVGTLRRPSFWSTSFLAETAEGRWTFRRSGCLGTGAEILDANSAPPIATFKQPWGGRGTLTFTNGETFHLECNGWWRPVWSVTTAEGKPVLKLHAREKTVETSGNAAVPDRRLSLLTMFVWYRVLQAQEDAASAAMVAITG